MRIIERAASDPKKRVSPVELAAEFNEPLGNCAYHVRAIVGDGLLVNAGTKPKPWRGRALFYKARRKLLVAPERDS